ncbi:hypothetical protein PG996_014807 [Apiospora saccharicola]|uniref:Uncharacterized protein n=1 Tax=Apiospora saccharicola TaxID=335842 RepID=A0ABR1TM21_9PEZI
MPLIYGEGSKAFWRLQEEMLKLTEDYTPLAWVNRPETATDARLNLSSVLAQSPWDLRDGKLAPKEGGCSYGDIRPITWDPFSVSPNRFSWRGSPHTEGWVPPKDVEPPRLTSRGLRITLPFVRSLSPDTEQQAGVLLAFIYSARESGDMVCLAIRKNDYIIQSALRGDYYRTLSMKNPRFVTAKSAAFEFRTIYIRSKPPDEHPMALSSTG